MSLFVRRILLILNVGGGFAGLATTLGIGASINFSVYAYGIVIFFIALYSYGIYVGVRLSEGAEVHRHLILYYALQVPFVSSPLVLYRFCSAIQITAAVVDSGVAWILHIGSDWQFALLQHNPYRFGANLFALAILLLLLVTKN
jgi:hypothetical protein